MDRPDQWGLLQRMKCIFQKPHRSKNKSGGFIVQGFVYCNMDIQLIKLFLLCLRLFSLRLQHVWWHSMLVIIFPSNISKNFRCHFACMNKQQQSHFFKTSFCLVIKIFKIVYSGPNINSRNLYFMFRYVVRKLDILIFLTIKASKKVWQRTKAMLRKIKITFWMRIQS